MTAALAERQILDLPADVEPIDAHPDVLTRQEWLRLRRGGIGGSDASTIIGANEYDSPLQLWTEKTANRTGLPLPPDQDVGPESPMWWGTMLEPVVAAAVARTLTVVDPKIMYWDHGAPVPRFFNPDRFVWDAQTSQWVPLEIKTAGFWKRDAWSDPDEPAPHAFAQIVHGDLVLGGPGVAYVAALIAGQDFRLMRVQIPDGLRDDVDAMEQMFWKRHVEPLVAPPADDRDLDFVEEMLLRMAIADGEVDLPAEARDIFDTWTGAGEAAKEAQETRDGARAQLLTMVGHHRTGIHLGKKMAGWTGAKCDAGCGEPLAWDGTAWTHTDPDTTCDADPRIKSYDNLIITTEDQARLADDHPDIYAEYFTPKPRAAPQFRVNWQWRPAPDHSPT